MHLKKRIILILFTGIMCISGSFSAYAQTNSLQTVQQKLNQKTKEKQSVNREIENIQKEMMSLNTYISKNKETMATTQNRIIAMNQQIEEKKEDIVILEDKILSRKKVMKKRLVALQHDNNLNIVIKVFLDSKNFNDFLQRASAVTALFNADKDILGDQQADLKQIEDDKKEIDKQQQNLENEQQLLADQQADLDQNLQKRQQSLTAMQEKYNQINNQIALVQKEKAGIQAQLKAAQMQIRKEQEANKMTSAPHTNVAEQVGKGEELYVTATAYSWQTSGATTRLGYNIKKNPNMKLIAVDPSVIPLGKKVWVEGYGVAIAGDTGGAIIGHRIDVLMPTKNSALSYGRKTVKVVILE